ncbi:VWA domain-containing protein [Sporosarcina highlanderae]|uniref:VWA domain-containing protein n=1 Tax=Sporosarcina highlanderae TaxID=3035916 RepID=A0ABT8JX93_9BACL|nr:VWA domain-containing protein [Sporosarcina highlanderae]MDN4608957.1 VWA domain-containing protein [Sporosarcina highlanderae]
MDIRIDEPLWLLLLIPVALYMAYTWKTSKMRFIGKGTILYALRSLSILCIVFALTFPYVLLPDNEEQILFVVDRSVSVEDAGASAGKWIADSLKSRNANQSVGIYSFAGTFRTDFQLTNGEAKLPKLEPMESSNATNIANAIDLSAAVAKSNLATRIVLLSDGLETEGSMDELLPKYENSRVQIDTVVLNRVNKADASILLFETPKTAYEGEKQLLRVEVESSSRKTGQLLIYRNDEEIINESVSLDEGGNVFSFHIEARGTGLLKYEAKLIVPDDGILENNRMLSITMLKQSPRVLVVQTERNQSVIPALLDQNAMDVDVVEAMQLPENLSGYLGYGAIIFDNVPGHLIGEHKMTVIEQAVKSFGTGFMMVGGDESFGLGGYFKSPIERLLPVEMEVKGKEQLPSLGLVIAMDRSGSMSGSKIVIAREAAARAVELLRDDDTFGFTAFDHEIWEVIPVGPLGNKQEKIDEILSIPAAGGTDIFPSVAKGYEDLADLKLQRKHIILLTDGQSGMPPDYEDIISEGKNNNVTLSTVAIGTDADGVLLEELAEIGGGRFYDAVDESTVPAILTRETSMLTRTYIEDDPFYATFSNVPEWTSIFRDGVPQMNAYIATTPKGSSTIVAESQKEDPVIAEWMYGLGRTIAFTSDSTGKWSGDLARWEGYSDFWNTAVARLLPTYEEVPYLINHERGGAYTVTDSSRKAAFLDIVIVDEKGNELPFQSEPLAPGKVRVTLKADPGLVFFGVSDDKGGLFEAGVSVPYSEEYKPSEPNVALLEKIAERTGGEILEDPAKVFRPHPFKSGNQKPIANWLIMLSMILFFIDITLRRFGMFSGLMARIEKKPVTESTSVVAEDHVSELLKAKRKR